MATIAEYIVRVTDAATNQLNRITGANGVLMRGFNQLRLLAGRVGDQIADSFREAANEIPLLGRALNLLKNPLTMVAGLVAGVGLVFSSTTAQAAEFNTQFRNLQNLNLDKSFTQLGGLKNTVLNNAYTNGFNALNASQAFFDVQSVTGKYGYEVDQIVSQQGTFARLMQADFNNYIEGTAKAMVNFGFGAEQLDAFNRSAYATVKVGAITFDQLSKVQSVYAGAAASARQSFDSANKVLSVFTLKTKSADEAATLTKSLFNDLSKQTTIDAFKKAGISLFDSQGNIKQVDSLLLELNKKFGQLGSNKAIVQLKNQFSGSEGLNALIQTATDQSGALVNTLDGFDATQLGLNKALALAKQDINYISDTLQNKIAAQKINVGNNLLPIKNWLLEGVGSGIEGANRLLFPTSYGQQTGNAHFMKYAKMAGDFSAMKPQEFGASMDWLKTIIERTESELQQNITDSQKKYMLDFGFKERSLKTAIAADSTLLEGLKSLQQQALVDFFTKNPLSIKLDGNSSFLPFLALQPFMALGSPQLSPFGGKTGSKGASNDIKNGITDAATGGTRSTNIYITIARLQASENINISNSKEGVHEIEDNIINGLTRALTIAESTVR